LVSLAEKPSTGAKVVVGGLILGGAALVIYNVFFRPKPTVKVMVSSYPIPTRILVDDKIEVSTPQTLLLTPGKHKFTVASQSMNMFLTYAFHKWIVNGTVVSHDTSAILNLSQPTTVTARFLVSEAGLAPIMEL
jgi:hypothetical protein